ncbi:hypothetical protein [Aphanothece hegewaldii]|nr:hypothetical protein [Aphanothece hegewaldii]
MPSEKELLEILELVKEEEQKLKKISETATNLAEQCQKWYEEAISKKEN